MASGDVNNCTTLSMYINELKSSISSWEDMTLKSQKLNSNLKISGQNINSIFDSLSSLCKIKDGTNYSGMEKIESMLNDLSIREKYFSDKILSFNNVIENNFVVNLSFHIENWKKSINNLKKEREFDGKKAKLDYKKAQLELSKLQSKVCKRNTNKKSLSDNITLQIDYAHQNLQSKMKFLEELERCSLKKAVYEERNRFKQFLECLRPVLDAQLSMKADLDELQLTYDKLYSTTDFTDLATLPADIESLIKQYSPIDPSGRDSISSLYSRANSQISLSSSYCSSQETGCPLPCYYYGSPPTLPSPECVIPPNDVDVSSSTLHELNLISPPDSITELDDDGSDRDSPTNDDRLGYRGNGQPKEPAFLYPNQAMPPPPYSNLLELKQNADKKYGVPVLLRGQSTWDHHTMATKRYSLNDDPNTGIAHGYQDCSGYLMPPPATHSESNGYATVSRPMYSSTPNGAIITSGTSTFKRRKPSTLVTAMEAPNIFDKRLNDDSQARRNPRSFSEDRSNSDIATMIHGVDRMLLGSRAMPAPGGRISVSNLVPPQNPVRLDSDHSFWTAQQQTEATEVTSNSATLNCNFHFKQQLLKVIQGDRSPYHKSLSPLSGLMF